MLLGTGCRWSSLDDQRAKITIEAKPVRLDAEPVTLSPSQVECGVQNELWERPPTDPSAERIVARLLPPGRALQFDDDVVVKDVDYRLPYVQIRGDFPVQLIEAPNISSPEKGVELVEARLSVVIPHMCFAAPLPLMGVKKGKFNQDILPTLRFVEYDDGWRFDKLMH